MRFPGRLLRDQWFWKTKKKRKKEGGANPGMVQKPFPSGWELEKQLGEAKGKGQTMRISEMLAKTGIYRG